MTNEEAIKALSLSDDSIRIIGICPNCGDSVNNAMQYCGECGQALDWSDVNEN